MVECVRDAAAGRRRIRVRGAGTVARPPSPEAIDLSLAGLSGLHDLRPGDLVATADAGTPLEHLAGALGAHGLRFPLRPPDPAWRGTVGAVFAAAADGLAAREGWRAGDVLLGARAVLGTGEAVAVGAGVLKSVAGFEVCRLLTGSRGTLAAITRVTFRVEAVPPASRTLLGTFAEAQDARRAIRAADALPMAPRALVGRAQAGDHRVLVLLEGPGAAVDAAATRLADHGLADCDPEVLAAWTREGCGDGWCTGPSSRGDPFATRRPDASDYRVDVLRGRFAAHVPQSRSSAPPNALFERVRAAFDPGGVYEAGRGYGAR